MLPPTRRVILKQPSKSKLILSSRIHAPFARPFPFEKSAQSQYRLHPQLRDARQMEPHNLRHLPQVQALLVVKTQDQPLPLWHTRNPPRKQPFQLAFLQKSIGRLLTVVTDEFHKAELIPFIHGVQAAKRYSSQLRHP